MGIKTIYRSSRPEMFLGKGVLKIYSKFAEIFRTPFPKNTSGRLLLNIEIVGYLFIVRVLIDHYRRLKQPLILIFYDFETCFDKILAEGCNFRFV